MLPQSLIETIKGDLTRHEGCVYEIYLDTEELETFGIGHLVTKNDPEHGQPVGTEVSEERVNEAFQTDFNIAYEDACALFLNLESQPDNVIRVCVNMSFNLGRNRLGQFKKMITAVNEGNYQKAADEMINSRWYGQVKTRGVELVSMMRDS